MARSSPGHEPCGVVVAVGSSVGVKETHVGQRVMVHHYQGCTRCNHCRSGWQQLCQEVPVKVYGNNAHGGHAQYLKVPANTLVPLPDELSFTAGAAIACGSGTAYSALRRMKSFGMVTTPSRSSARGRSGLPPRNTPRRWGEGDCATTSARSGCSAPRRSAPMRWSTPGSNDPVAAIKDLTHGRLRGLDAGHLEQLGCALERDPLHQGVGPDVLRRRRRRRPYRCEPASVAPAIDAGGVMDVLQHHPGGLRAVFRSSAASTSITSSPTAGASTRRTKPTNCSTGRSTARACS